MVCLNISFDRALLHPTSLPQVATQKSWCSRETECSSAPEFFLDSQQREVQHWKFPKSPSIREEKIEKGKEMKKTSQRNTKNLKVTNPPNHEITTRLFYSKTNSQAHFSQPLNYPPHGTRLLNSCLKTISKKKACIKVKGTWLVQCWNRSARKWTKSYKIHEKMMEWNEMKWNELEWLCFSLHNIGWYYKIDV